MAVERQKNNFDLIRLIAASLVIFSHAFGICGMEDPVLRFTGTLAGGQVAVYIFFLISGYLITASWLRRPELIPFFEKRILRIYPALITVLLLSIFVFGPLITQLSLRDYFSNPTTYTYLINLSLWKMQYALPGIYIDGKELFFNYPLWTLFFEFIMYISVALFGISGIISNDRKKIFICWILFILFVIMDSIGIPKEIFILKISAFNFVRFFIFFYSGSLYYIYLKDKKPDVILVLLLILAAIITRKMIFFNVFSMLAIISTVFWFAFLKIHPLNFIISRGDFSYGIYIYGSIVQNFIHYYLGCIPLAIKIPLSILLTFPFAIFSWKMIESKALKLKLRI
jgi:peptidoglycan/LPS O-acetylase OafA/YrhL